MYTIESEDYVNAYIAAVSEEIRQDSEEIRQSRRSPTEARDFSGAVYRLYRTVTKVLSGEEVGPRRTTEPPLPTG